MVAKDLFAGSMGGAMQVIVGQPFDIVKVRMQKNPNLSMGECIKAIMGKEGPFAFYKGKVHILKL